MANSILDKLEYRAWKPLQVDEFEEFRKAIVEKWIRSVKLNIHVYEEADRRYDEFKKHKKLEWAELKKTGLSVSSYEKSEERVRLGGFRGQKWFDEMLFDFRVKHSSELKWRQYFNLHEWEMLRQKIEELGFDPKESTKKWLDIKHCLEIRFDCTIRDFGPVEVKTIPLGKEDYVNIKKTPWNIKPSAYLVILKTLDKEMLEFQFIGWLFGYEVFKLPVETALRRLMGSPDFYFCKIDETRKPKNLLNLLLGLSEFNPESQSD